MFGYFFGLHLTLTLNNTPVMPNIKTRQSRLSGKLIYVAHENSFGFTIFVLKGCLHCFFASCCTLVQKHFTRQSHVYLAKRITPDLGNEIKTLCGSVRSSDVQTVNNL